ncbi:MAG TPA: hypothetical protein VF101_04055 [Gaiellaceae bacterium]
MPWSTIAATAAATAPWLLAVAIVYFRRRPPKPEPGPPTLDLGPEPPAVANLLVHDFGVTRDAVPATLIDLAARRLVEIEEREPGSYVCRLEKGSEQPLTSYERRVMDLLHSRASGGIVPAEALTTGPSSESSRWWKGFRSEVVADAQQRGLCRDILDGKTFRRLALAAIGPAVVLALLADGKAGLIYWVAAAFLLGAVMTLHTQRPTPEGLAAASRWLGVRAKLHEDDVLPTMAPIAVTLWERHMAYAAAFGVAPAAVRAIPMGAESDYRAWSSYGGRWHAVRIRYPYLVPPGWGRHPALVLFRAALALAAAVVVLWVSGDAQDVAADFGKAKLAGVLIFVVLPAAVAAVAALVVVRALADLGSTREISGQILRLRTYGDKDDKRHYVAIDDGASATIRAFRVKPELYSSLRQYELVTGTVTRNLRYVRSLREAATETASQVAPADVAAAT